MEWRGPPGLASFEAVYPCSEMELRVVGPKLEALLAAGSWVLLRDGTFFRRLGSGLGWALSLVGSLV